MQITNCGRGIHKREVKGVDRFRALPSHWYAFTNLDLALGVNRGREVDLIILTDRRIFVVDIKDWYGRIESVDGRWFLDGKDQDPSPVTKVIGIARDIFILLREMLSKRPETKKSAVPSVVGLVVLTGKADRSGIAETEISKVLTIDEFLKSVSSDKSERNVYGNVAEQFVAEPLTENVWKDRLSRFFNVNVNPSFKPGRRNFHGYVAEESASYAHPNGIYREYEAQEDGTPPSLGTLRLWDFTKVADARFQTEEGRREIAGRERQVYHWLLDRTDAVERSLLTPRIDDRELGVNYWEIYDRRRRLKRLTEFSITETKLLSPNERLELARQFLSVLAELHRHEAAHLDLGGHSIWLEAPSTVRLSHLFASRFPVVKSLGPARYQFLASVQLPEDVLGSDNGPLRRDVFLAGVAVHQILFGILPGGEPPEWSAEVDTGQKFTALHDWFCEALDTDASNRFANGQLALAAFNKATIEHPTPEEVLTGLETFRGPIRSQLTLIGLYPMVGLPLREDDSVTAWRSVHESRAVILKVWKHAAWGDLKKEGPRVLAFLERARSVKADSPPNIPVVREVLWLGDALAIAQDWATGSPLSALIAEPPPEWRSPEGALAVVLKLIQALNDLHASGFGHGDLKPDNLVLSDDGTLWLIDTLDFSPAIDGDKQSDAYAPPGGNRLERDRYSATKVAEEIFGIADFPPEQVAALAAAIGICRDKEPQLATLLPLEEAIRNIQKKLGPTAESAEAIDLALSIRNAETGPIASDEGFYHLRMYAGSARGSASLHVRGATEEIEIRLDKDGNPISARRRALGQTQISIVSRHEFFHLPGEIDIVSSEHNDLADLEQILSTPAVQAKLQPHAGAGSEAAPAVDELDDLVLDDEGEQETLVEEIASASDNKDAALAVDVPLLWRTLVKTEKDLTTEAVAEADSVYDRLTRRHRVAIDLQSGAFDFNRNDTVGVLREDRRGWRRIGELDIRSSRATAAFIDPTDYGASSRLRLVEAGQRLRFVSHFETESLRRRTEAVDRILGGAGRQATLLSVFDPRTGALPVKVDHPVEDSDLETYELNDDQTAAFRQIIGARPIGLLQGPPGTGKTRFIAALAHFAITKNLARNVLLSSQSHEAVNTAGEALLQLFRKAGDEPSILRVAMNDDQVSDLIRPFHTRRVEQSFKDRFEAEFRERQIVVARALGIPEEICESIIAVETAVRPIAARLVELSSGPDSDEQRMHGLRESLAGHLKYLQLDPSLANEVGKDPEAFTAVVLDELQQRYRSTASATEDRIARLRATIRLGRDFVGSASRQQRSFETFLAGTRQIVVGTCVGLGRSSLGLIKTAFDLVIVDEAARCTASELLVPLQAARWAVLVGDQAQLEPHHDAEVLKRVSEATNIPKNEIQRSDFERVFFSNYAAKGSARLKKQYRMLPPIGRLISEVFYPNLTLEPGRLYDEIGPGILPDELTHPLTWVRTDELKEVAWDKKKPEGRSRTNRIEADAIIALLTRWYAQPAFAKWMAEQAIAPIAIGVICTYAAQRDLIHQSLLRSPLGHLLSKQVKVGTVDSYQGKENPIVILSLVRNNRDGAWESGAKTIQEGFLSSPNRINVSASRAKDRLIIVGAHDRWRSTGPMGRLVKAFGKLEEEGTARFLDAAQVLGLSPHKESSASAKPASGKEKSNG